MKELLTGENRIQKICDALQRETLEPAREQAELIIKEAEEKALLILEEAKKEKENMHKQAKEMIDKERNVFHSSLTQASRQVFEELKQKIEKKLFDDSLIALCSQGMQETHMIAKIIDYLCHAIDKEGLGVDLKLVLSKDVDKTAVIRSLSETIQKRFSQEGAVVIEDFSGGVKIRLKDKEMSLDFTNDFLYEMLSSFLRKDFRKFLFQKDA